jgi:hypothetical protein
LLKIPECGCEKYVHRNAEIRNPKHTPQNGTCSVETFSRGPGQKIIGFTFYEPIKEEKEIGQAHHMFSRILRLPIYQFFYQILFVLISQIFKTLWPFFEQ